MVNKMLCLCLADSTPPNYIFIDVKFWTCWIVPIKLPALVFSLDLGCQYSFLYCAVLVCAPTCQLIVRHIQLSADCVHGVANSRGESLPAEYGSNGGGQHS